MENSSLHKSTLLTLVVAAIFAEMLTDQEVFLFVAIGLGLAGLISSKLTALVHRLWMGLAKLLSLIVPKILLSLVYYLILTPFAFLSRIFGKSDPLLIKKPEDSSFRKVENAYPKESFEKSW